MGGCGSGLEEQARGNQQPAHHAPNGPGSGGPDRSGLFRAPEAGAVRGRGGEARRRAVAGGAAAESVGGRELLEETAENVDRQFELVDGDPLIAGVSLLEGSRAEHDGGNAQPGDVGGIGGVGDTYGAGLSGEVADGVAELLRQELIGGFGQGDGGHEGSFDVAGIGPDGVGEEPNQVLAAPRGAFPGA